MFIIYYIFGTHSCPEDWSSAWIKIKHSEFPEIPPECFPGASGRSWTVALATVRLCSQPPWSRCTPPSSPPTHFSPMRIPLSTMTGWRVKNRTFLACVSLCTGHVHNFLAIRWARAFRTSRSVGCRLYLHHSRRTWRERRDCMVAQERCRWCVSSLLTNWLTILQPFDTFTFTFS